MKTEEFWKEFRKNEKVNKAFGEYWASIKEFPGVQFESSLGWLLKFFYEKEYSIELQIAVDGTYMGNVCPGNPPKVIHLNQSCEDPFDAWQASILLAAEDLEGRL